MVLQGESISGKGNSTCKGPELAVCLAHSRNSKEAVAAVGRVSEGVKQRVRLVKGGQSLAFMLRWLPAQGAEQSRDGNLGGQPTGFACGSDAGCARKSQGHLTLKA